MQRAILPLIVFPALTALMFNFMLAPIGPSGLVNQLKAQCASLDITPYALSYTGYTRVDTPLCGLVAFFHNTMDEPIGLEHVTYFLATGIPLALFPCLEASRSQTNILLAFPLPWLLLGQRFTLAVSMSLYCLVFLVTGSHLSKKKEDAKITQSHAESLVFGLFVGYIAPSVGLLFLKDPQVTALWQIYPAFMSIASGVHFLIRRPSRFGASGWPFIQGLLLAVFMFSSSIHFATVWPIVDNQAALKTLFLPSIAILPPSTPVGLQTLNFLQWDMAFAFASPILATLWFNQSATGLLILITWYIVAIPLAGPGAALAGVLLWRESQIQ